MLAIVSGWQLVVSFAAGATAATIPAWLGLRGQKAQREHEQEMANKSRRAEDLRDVYPAILRFLVAEMERMRRTRPTIGNEGEPVPNLDDDSLFDLEARVYAYASEPVKLAVDELLGVRRRFGWKAQELTDVQRRESLGRSSESDNPGRLYAELDSLRREANERLDALRVLVRDELSM